MASHRPTFLSRWLVATTWPIGVALTAWDYMWRSTPMHRHESRGLPPGDPPPTLPTQIDTEDLMLADGGFGPLFHRCYRTRIRDATVSEHELVEAVMENINRAAPTTFARFQKLSGKDGPMTPGDEYVVRMPGPWDGPVRVLATGENWFRLGTLDGHLEAGQIEFRARSEPDGRLRFEIESWARSSGKLVHLLYHRLKLAKEVQAHMWISFLEGAVKLSGGRMTGGIEIETRRFEEATDD